MSRIPLLGMPLLISLIAIGACDRQARLPEDSQSSALDPLACWRSVSIDSVVFSTVLRDPATLDLSGVELRFDPRRPIAGQYREAAGEFGEWVPLADLEVDTQAATLMFTLPGATDSSRFVGRWSCDSLWGEFRAYRNTAVEALVFRRTHPGVPPLESLQ